MATTNKVLKEALALKPAEKAELIDMYVKEKRNATFRFTYRDPLKTISFEEAEAVHVKLMAFVNDHLVACN